MLAAIAGSSVVACSSDVTRGSSQGSASNEDLGSIGLRLVPVSGVTINSVNYVVTGTPAIPGTALPSGVLPTPGTASSFNFGVQVPVGTGYTLSLTAASAETGDDVTCTGSVGPFNVAPNTPTNISVTLTCRDNSTGQFIAAVDVKTDACPRLVADYVVAIPAAADVGKNIDVNALGHDLDGKTVKYAWSIPAANASVGSFAAPAAQATTFACQHQGTNVPVTVTMSNGECSRPLLTTVSCNDVLCGNGVLDPGETCDKGIPAGQPGGGAFGCPANCQFTCGNGVVETPAEQCELPNGVPTIDCTAQCRTRVPACGDGFINGTEQCDGTLIPAGEPAGTTCNPDCTLNVPKPAVCGDGIVNGTEQCEPPSSETCADTCLTVATAACVACEQAGACAAESDACLNFTGADRANCFAAETCIKAQGCGKGANTLTSCFCGSLSTANCIAAPNSGAGAPDGVCAAVLRAAMSVGGDTPTNAQVLTRFIDESVPGGAGVSRYNCEKADPACINICGF
jgi:hypothetical protein